MAGPGLPPQPLVMTLQLDTGPLLTPFIPTVFGIYTYLYNIYTYLLTAVYLLCWTPHWATQLLLVFAPPGSVSQQGLVTAALASTCLQYSNSAINPVLYTFLSDHFRRSFLDTCWCRGAGPSLHHRDLTFTTRRTRRGPVYTAVMPVSIIFILYI